ncbi:MAG: class I SAM-dependent RNA methyltransferase [Ignavibacteria bacterium]|nr:class I SAM-dependent RNA methyltransferase [Ignavibacteria bacterium]
MIKKGDEINVNVIELNSEGKGVSKLEDGFVIFSGGTLPGDEALIKISKKKSNFAEAKLIEIIKPSQYRKDPECSYFGVCGGCKLQNYDYEKQIDYKTNVVRNAFERIGGFKDLIIPEAIRSDDVFFYRNKMEFSFSDDEWVTEKDINTERERFALGLHVPKFHSKIINIEKCFLQSEISNSILNFTRDFLKRKTFPFIQLKHKAVFSDS